MSYDILIFIERFPNCSWSGPRNIIMEIWRHRVSQTIPKCLWPQVWQLLFQKFWVSFGFQQLLFPLLVASAPAVDLVPTVHNIPSILVFPQCQFSLVLPWILLILLFLLLLCAWKPCSGLNSAAASLLLIISLLLLMLPRFLRLCYCYIAHLLLSASMPLLPSLLLLTFHFHRFSAPFAVVCFPLCSCCFKRRVPMVWVDNLLLLTPLLLYWHHFCYWCFLLAYKKDWRGGPPK